MKSLRILQVGGAFFFVIVVFVTILFAQGYQYDLRQREIVKKSVLLFEKLPTDALVLVDGKPLEFAAQGGLRLEPGQYRVEVSKPGAVSWKKQITVPEDEVVRFPEIVLMPENGAGSLVVQTEPRHAWRLQSASESGLLLENQNLHFAKWFSFSSPSDFTIFDLALPASFQKLVALSRHELIGLTKEQHLFSYDVRGRTLLENRTAVLKDIAITNKKRFTLDSQGKVWDIPDDISRPMLFFGATDEAKRFTNVAEVDGIFLFLLETSHRNHLLVLTDSSGAILFQEKAVDAAFLDRTSLFYSTATHFVHYDFQEKKIILELPITHSLGWFSRIGDSFHFLFLTKDGELKFCDQDMENCTNLSAGVDATSSPAIFSSKNRDVFVVPLREQFEWFDFTEHDALLPTLLNHLVSFL